MKTLLFVLLMNIPVLVLASEAKVCWRGYDEMCQKGNLNCISVGCMGRKLIIVRDKHGKPCIFVVKTPCFGELVVFKNEDQR